MFPTAHPRRFPGHAAKDQRQRAAGRMPKVIGATAGAEKAVLDRLRYLSGGTTERPRTGIEKELLRRLGRCPALIVAIAGQTIPKNSGRSWASLAYATVLRPMTSVEDRCDDVCRKHGSTAVTPIQIKARRW